MRKALVAATVFASGAALAGTISVTATRGLGPADTGGWREDPASVSGFVAALRAEIERSPLRAHVPARSVQDAVSRILPDLEGTPRCLTPIVLEVSRQQVASAALASYVAPALAPPALSRAAISTSADGSFAIHYTLDRSSGDAVIAADRDGNGSPDYVDLVAASLASSREALVSKMGFRPAEANAPLQVYLVNLGGRIDGYTSAYASGDGYFVVLDSRLLGNDALLRAAVAHQYAHATLAAYAPTAPVWWAEASSAWLEGAVVGSYAHYTDRIQAAIESAAAGLADDDVRLCQGHLLWPAYLASSSGRDSLVRRIWENLEQQADSVDLWTATDEALREAGSSIEKAFSDYSLWILLSGDRSDGKHFTLADRLQGVSFVGEYGGYPAAQIQTAPQLAPLGATFMRFDADGADGGLRLRFEGDSPGIFQAQVLLKPRKEGAPLVRAPIAIDERGRGSIGIPWGTFSEAILIAGNVARAGEAPYSFVARTDPRFPFELVSFKAEPGDGEVRITWETESEDGLFGWIVYRSDRPKGPPRRVNEFIVPAIGDGDGPVSYEYIDDGVARGHSYSYKLIGITQDGLTREVPEARVSVPR